MISRRTKLKLADAKNGKLVYHLFSALAEFQRDTIVENTRAGMCAAKRRGNPIGRPRSLDVQAVVLAHEEITQTGARRQDAANIFGVSCRTLDRAIKRLGLDEAA